MCSRTSSIALGSVIALAACAPEADAPPGDAVECALGARAAFAPACTFERERGADGRFVVHHLGGSFRRLRYDAAAGEVAAADGADKARVEAAEEGYVAFTVGADRYRIPHALLADAP